MTLSQAQALQDATKRVKNRSAWINGAIESKIVGGDSYSISDVSDQGLTLHYHNRFCTECKNPQVDFATCPTYLILSRIAEKKTESGE